MGSQCCTLQSCHQHACSSSLMLPGGAALDMMKRQKLCMHWFIFRTGAIIVTASVKFLFARFSNSDLRVCFWFSRRFAACMHSSATVYMYVCAYIGGQRGDIGLNTIAWLKFWEIGGLATRWSWAPIYSFSGRQSCGRICSDVTHTVD